MIIILFWTLSCLCGHKDTNLRAIHNLCGHKDTNLRAIHNWLQGNHRPAEVAFVGTKILI